MLKQLVDLRRLPVFFSESVANLDSTLKIMQSSSGNKFGKLPWKEANSAAQLQIPWETVMSSGGARVCFSEELGEREKQ